MSGIRLFAGTVRPLPGDSRVSGIVKTAVDGPARITVGGLAGDAQADRKAHGGPDKALHFYPPEHYVLLAARFPAAAPLLVAGSIGENISAAGLDEARVRIGDIFALGSARVQVCQPRQPCWKIDARYGVEGMTALIAETGMTGGYLRVLAEGVATAGEPIALIDREPAAPTLAEFWQAWMAHRPDPALLERHALVPALPESWRRKLRQRIDWLRGAVPPAIA